MAEGGGVVVVRVTFITGYKDEIETKVYGANPGMASRFTTIEFEDFSQSQMADIWRHLCRTTGWECSEEVCVIASRRVARGIGHKGFGNARAVRNLFHRAVSNAKQRFLTAPPEARPTISIVDVIGREPTCGNLPGLAAALQELDRLVGIPRVKASIHGMVRMAHSNYERELRGERTNTMMLNRMFLGNPGTGKTTVAKLYGQVLKELGLLTNGDVVYKTASDLTGDHVGESQQKTRALVELAKGRVLVIDEAYALDDGNYGKQALDALVEKVSGDPGDDLAVVLCGYEAPMLKMLRDQNPGLSRRFNPASAFQFDDFDDYELLQVVARCCAEQEVHAPIEVKLHAVAYLARRRALPNFGNAGAAKVLVADMVQHMTARCRRDGTVNRSLLMEDVEVDGAVRRADPLAALKGLSDVGDFRRRLEDIGHRIAVRRKEGRSTAGIVGNFVFTGAPGTGKTTVAKCMSQVLYSYGVLATDHVEMTSALDLTGEYLGHTKKHVEEKMQAARGGVLFIDEAYELGTSRFGEEAMTKLLQMLTEPDYMDSKTVVVLAGYRFQMDAMLARNPGLRSRFPEHLHFADWCPERCADEVLQRASAADPQPYQLEAVDGDVQGIKRLLHEGFRKLQQRAGWANARDAIQMFKNIEIHREVRVAREGAERATAPFILERDVQAAIEAFLAARPANFDPGIPREGDNNEPAIECSSAKPPSRLTHQAEILAPELKKAAAGDTAASEDSDDSGSDDAAYVDEEAADEQNDGEQGMWRGLDVTTELVPLNEALEQAGLLHNESEVQRLLNKSDEKETFGVLLPLLVDRGLQEDVAQDILQRWIAAAKQARKEKQREEEQARRWRLVAIYRCAVCGRTGRWCPCSVAPYLLHHQDPQTGKVYPPQCRVCP